MTILNLSKNLAKLPKYGIFNRGYIKQKLIYNNVQLIEIKQNKLNEFMEWNIIFDPDFRIWFYQQEQGFQNEVFAVLGILAKFRPSLGRPRVDTLEGSDFSNMKELRIQHQG